MKCDQRSVGMGLWMSKLLTLFGEKEARILVLGLDNAGKTTILCKFPCCGENVPFVTLCNSGTWLTGASVKCYASLLTDRLQVGEVVSTIPSKSLVLKVAAKRCLTSARLSLCLTLCSNRIQRGVCYI